LRERSCSSERNSLELFDNNFENSIVLATIHARFLEVSVTIIARRKLLAGAGACSLSSFIPFGRWEGADGSEDASIVADEDELPHGCIFAGLDPRRSPEEEPAAASIDFWTFRVSEIESSTLPRSVGRVIIWDDLFSPRTLVRRVKSILKVFPEWYGFDPLLGRCSFHLDGFSEIRPIAQAVIPATTESIAPHRLALIDIDSCGVSRIDWPDILPCLHNSYDLVIGFTHFTGHGHLQELCNEALDNSRTLNALACCDLSLWTSDFLLGFDEVLDYEARAPLLTALVHDLIQALSGTDLVRTLSRIPEVTHFRVSRLRPERPHENSSPLIDGNIVL
jgi:hypothetical protein